ncbi:acetyl-CoA synthetase-like protein [Periconia macrospinosa]|uniref:Acetyl-CoA synthetase-like protein n=1 Tax=Periconia macrospinosa TaxID=97972 RepID=A0A2V1DEE9_9PLEO|nr:acetyl-CoA synthetase-like protein [Periconia macrospinosa]
MQLLPPVSPFLELIERADRNPKKIILRDHSSGVSATSGQLLHSISSFRAKVHKNLLRNPLYDATNMKDDKFIFLLAPPGFEYVVSMLTIFSLGAAISAQSIAILPEEMIRLFKLGKPVALLYSSAFADKIEAIKGLLAETDSGVNHDLPFVQIETSFPEGLESQVYKTEPIFGEYPTHTGSLFFTSGTSGNQKGVVHSFQALLASARERIGTWQLKEEDVVLNQKPGNWMGGIFGILPTLISGACLDTCAGVFDPKFFWERVKEGDVRIFDIAATGYDRLAQYFDENIAILPSAEKERYVQGVTAVRVAGVSGSILTPHTQKKWTELRSGKPLINLYGCTEMTLIACMRWENPVYDDMCSVGQPVPGMQVKIVDGDIRLKAPTMFSRYISHDLSVTAKVFDEEGFFKTGDCGSMVGDCLVLHGRANIDVLHFWGFTVVTSEVETAILSLPYISDVTVLPLEDEEYDERVAAIIKTKPSASPGGMKPNLEALRKDLSAKNGLMLFKQPTVAYWLGDNEEISLTANGKVSKRDAKKKFFGEGWKSTQKVEILDLKTVEYWRMGGQC